MIRPYAIGAIGVLAAGLGACSDAPETASAAGSADEVRSVTTFRQWHGESHLGVEIMLVGGSLRVEPGPRNELFRLTSSYTNAKSVPDGMYYTENNQLSISRRAENAETDETKITVMINPKPTVLINQHTTDTDDESNDNDGDDHATASTLALSPAVATKLDINLMGTKGDIELGGLQTSALDIKALTGETSVRFSQPNAATCTRLNVEVGLSELSLIGLGNSGCQTLDVTGAAGRVTLDFTGSWPASATMHAKIVAGSLKIRVPRDVGVRLTSQDKVLANLLTPGMHREGDALVSPNYASAARRLDIETTAVAGQVELERIN